MLIDVGKLTFGEPEKRTIWPVLDAIEDGLDVEDLHPEYRAILADLHDDLGRCIGQRVLTTGSIPSDWITDHQRREFVAKLDRTTGPDGIRRLALEDEVIRLLMDADLCTVDDVEAADRDGRVTTIKGLGVLRVEQIRSAVRWHRTRREQVQNALADVTPHELAWGPGGINELHALGVKARTLMKLYAQGITLIADLERLDSAGELEAVPGLGPRILKQLREAIESYRNERTEPTT